MKGPKIFSILVVLVVIATTVQSEFVINIITDGNYSLGFGNRTWLSSSPPFFYVNGKKCTTADGSLQQDHNDIAHSGMDKLGPWQSDSWIWRADDMVFSGTLKTYQTNQLPLIIFSQKYFNDTVKTRGANANTVISSFPGFQVTDLDGEVGYLSFGGNMMGDAAKKMGIWNNETLDINDGLNGGPLVLFDKHGNTILMQAFSNFMTVSVWYDNVTSSINWGIMGDVDTVPAGFEMSVVLYYTDRGINSAFDDLGKRMRYWYGKTDYYNKLDTTLSHLGYWTDNGAYYYYNTETNDTNYENTLLDVIAYSRQIQIPYRYVQLDSWWYLKGPLGGVKDWKGQPEIFPNGLKFLHKKIDLPLAAHNRYWSEEAVYAKKNGGKYHFQMDKNMSLPDDPTFWDDFLTHAKSWGLIMYEQDWMDVQLHGVEALKNDLTLGQRWLEEMGRAADKNRMTIQYCMSLPREALQSLTIPTVTQARASIDYHLRPDQWKIGISSLFALSLGLSPSKDTFWTSKYQPGNTYDQTEPHPVLQALVAVLSTGPVGPGDMINGTDRDLLLRCCNEDGLILKPSKPATAIDAQITEAAFKDGSGVDGEVWSTYTQFDDVDLRFGIILAVNTSWEYTITRWEAGFVPYPDKWIQNVIFPSSGNWTMEPFNEKRPFTIPACNISNFESFCLYYTSPVITIGDTNIIILGDLNKFVPMSPQRVYKIYITGDAVALTLRGKPGETITLNYIVNTTKKQVAQNATSFGCADFTVYTKQGSSFVFPSGTDCKWQATTTPAPPTPTTSTSPSTTSSTSTTTTPTPKTSMKTTPATPSSANMNTGLGIVLPVVAILSVLQITSSL